ncbi:hypothetical protein [Persicirhabdus sediminis]|uniref:Uncharacterized protein n=1 Tax=Persicirhabdus sediminis TaxID=454144 RepID=A0A8J7MF25_9BACT|nr:hypothetical protein [Persicirhabdus sediminis]MBK1791506.1 hypothetical protein [Persicirhabdus sediminis]
MFQASSLSPEQVEQISQWIDGGCQLAELQKKIDAELGIRITYMDTRFLVSDLGLEIKSPTEEKVAADAPLQQKVATGHVTVSVDEIVKPGALVSGQVEFADGERAIWYLDQEGRLGLDADTPGYQPSENDVMSFQTQLQSLLQQQ